MFAVQCQRDSLLEPAERHPQAYRIVSMGSRKSHATLRLVAALTVVLACSTDRAYFAQAQSASTTASRCVC